MTQFLDVRLWPVGGELATSVAVNQGANINDYTGLLLDDLLSEIRGQHVLIATHGFNVNRSDGIDCLSNWEGLLQFPPTSPFAFVGLLWPGDSIWAHGLDYPEEPKLADDAGALLGPYIDATFADAASVSFASHSLGARVVLSTIAHMNSPVRRLVLMAGAVDDDCLTNEFQAAAAKVGEISVLSSKKDEVLSFCFPLGNFFAGILDVGHPWWRAAVGHCGPVTPWPTNFQAPFAIPKNWNYQHGDYLRVDRPPAANLPIPTDIPGNGADFPDDKAPGWSEAFSAAFAHTRFL
jgi:pimeloyl-ACP methyl ester carboxylesterase